MSAMELLALLHGILATKPYSPEYGSAGTVQRLWSAPVAPYFPGFDPKEYGSRETYLEEILSADILEKVLGSRRAKPTAEEGEAFIKAIKENTAAVKALKAHLQSPRLLDAVAEQEDIADTVAKMKGRWVSQDEFWMMKRYKSVEILHRYREKRNIKERSQKNPRIGKDKVGNIFRKVGDKQSDTFEYFVPD